MVWRRDGDGLCLGRVGTDQWCNNERDACGFDSHKRRRVALAPGWYLINCKRKRACFRFPHLPLDVADNSDAFNMHRSERYKLQQWIAIIAEFTRGHQGRQPSADGGMVSNVEPEAVNDAVEAITRDSGPTPMRQVRRELLLMGYSRLQ